MWARLVNKSRIYKVGPIFVNTNYTFEVDRSTVLSYEVKLTEMYLVTFLKNFSRQLILR